MSAEVRVNTGELSRQATEAMQLAFRSSMGELDAQFDDAIASSVWAWPRNTRRRRGGLVGSPRNIIDEGNLRQTSVWGLTTPLSARFRWSAPYSTAVHEGATLRNGTRLPARPWTGAVLGTRPVNGIAVYDVTQRVGSRLAAYLNRTA